MIMIVAMKVQRLANESETEFLERVASFGKQSNGKLKSVATENGLLCFNCAPSGSTEAAEVELVPYSGCYNCDNS